MKSWTVYILRCGDGSLYAGVAIDMRARLDAHRCGKGARYTRSRLPVRLVYKERVRDRSAALRREIEIKRLTRAEKMVLIACKRSHEGSFSPAGSMKRSAMTVKATRKPMGLIANEAQRKRVQRKVEVLGEFLRKHPAGTLSTGSSYRGVPIGRFATWCRYRHRNGGLSPWLSSALEAIPGWTWEPHPSRSDPYPNVIRLRAFLEAHDWDEATPGPAGGLGVASR